MKLGFLYLFFFFLPLIIVGQKYSFISYTTTQGLPQSQVTSIVQDSENYLWIGTLGGLAKFNGGTFETFSSEDGLLNNRITHLSQIGDVLYIGHEGGVTKYLNNRFKSFSFIENEKNTNVKSIVKFQNEIYVGSHYGVYKLNEKGLVKVFQKSQIVVNHVRSMVVYKKKLYIASMEGLYVVDQDSKVSKIETVGDINLSSISIRNNQLFLTSYFEGVFLYDPVLNLFKNIQGIPEDFVLKGAFNDSYSNTWIHSNSGIIVLDQNDNIEIINQLKGLNYDVISSVYEDVEGTIWIGTLGKGILRFPSREFTYYDKSSGLVSDLILTIREDKDKSLWFGTFDQGIMHYKFGKIESFDGFMNNTIWTSELNFAGANWFGTDYGLISIDQKSNFKIFYHADGLPSDAVTAMLALDQKRMLLGGINGISIFNGESFKFLDESKNIGIVRDFDLLNNVLYIGTSKGLYVKKGDKIKKVNGLNKPVSCLKSTERNHLFVGTEEGLFELIGNNLKQIVISNTPSANLINFLNYKDEKLYIGTNNGLYIVSEPNSSFSIKHFGIGEGVIDIETNLNSSYFDSRGGYWFGTSSGLVKYNYKSKVKFDGKPRISLKSVLLNYSKSDLKKFCKGIDEKGVPKSLILPFYKNNLAFEMDGISLSNYSNLTYQFKLEGLDDEWSPPSKNTLISFSGLSDNEYKLRMRAIDENGVYSNEIIVPFIISTPFFKELWFIISISSLLLLLIYIIFKIRVKRELEYSNNQMLNYKSKLMALEHKSLNASMNRHFIFNALNSIQYFINSQDKLSANRYLTNFAKLIRKNLDATNEDGNEITLTQELEGLDLYLSLEEMRFKGKFRYQISCEEVDTDSIFIPAMLLQPFIENAIIHGVLPNEDKEGLISVDVKIEQNYLIIQIQDNGVGINNSLKMKDDSNGDHKSQGMEITAKRIDLIKKISNKGFEIIGPFQVGGIDSVVEGTKVILKIPVDNFED